LGSQKYITDAFGVELNERTNVKTAPGKYQTSVENVFVGQKPLLLTHELDLGYEICTEFPEKVGCDRLADIFLYPASDRGRRDDIFSIKSSLFP